MCAMCIVQEKKGPSNYPSNLTSLIRGPGADPEVGTVGQDLENHERL